MNITLNLTPLTDFFKQPVDVVFFHLLGEYGWLILAIMFLFGVRELWLIYVQTKWAMKNKFILLAIDVPRANEQSPRAVENMFSYLAGAHGSINFFEKWFEGKFQLAFSYEIVSIDGYTQFLVRTPVDFRGLVESAIYSQYPDAEIVEVDDYTEGLPRKFPNDDYDLWGSEFIQAQPAAYPIKLFEEFEHKLGVKDEIAFKDPMAPLMDLCSSLRPGEQLWYQIILIPTDFKWVKESEKEVDKIMGVKPKKKEGILGGLFWLINEFAEIIYSIFSELGGEKDAKKDEDKSLSMMDLRPKQKRQMEAIHQKVTKLGYLVKIRMVYIAKKEVFNSKAGSSFVGYIKQFATLDLNNLKPDTDMTMTKAAYFNKTNRLNHKKSNLINNYIGRSGFNGRNPGLLNIEELATLWHFPIEHIVKAPMLQKTAGKKAKPPMALPTHEVVSTPETLEPLFDDKASESAEDKKTGGVPNNLPF
jgi:hypothetical protein